jgi:hypothetical protein
VKGLKLLLTIMVFAAFGVLAPAVFTQDKSDTANSDVQALREEIAAAPNESERGQLQLKLVDLLISKGMKQEAIAELPSEAIDPQIPVIADFRLPIADFFLLASNAIDNWLIPIGNRQSAIDNYFESVESV